MRLTFPAGTAEIIMHYLNHGSPDRDLLDSGTSDDIEEATSATVDIRLTFRNGENVLISGLLNDCHLELLALAVEKSTWHREGDARQRRDRYKRLVDLAQDLAGKVGRLVITPDV